MPTRFYNVTWRVTATISLIFAEVSGWALAHLIEGRIVPVEQASSTTGEDVEVRFTNGSRLG